MTMQDDELSRLAEATEKRALAQALWIERMREASRSNTLRAVGRVAGISHARVAQIVGRRA